ncbi:hypothetical protein AMC78_CH02595 [Rhizobium phaseoli]|nr:hypothetical protein AMC78_CH02595 [Rhizobium phaseoli]
MISASCHRGRRFRHPRALGIDDPCRSRTFSKAKSEADGPTRQYRQFAAAIDKVLPRLFQSVAHYGHPHDLAWLASKTSTTKSAMSGSISLACLVWIDGGAFMISARLPISVNMTHIIAPNVMMAAVNNMVLVMAVL